MSSKNNKKSQQVHDHKTITQYNTPQKFTLPITTRPCFPPEAPTPPPRTTAISVPFKWEEAPGKPKERELLVNVRLDASNNNKNNNVVRRALELPPRLLLSLESGNHAPSPTTVLEGPYVARAMSFTTSYRDSKESFTFGSSRWSGLRKNNRIDGEGSFDFSTLSVDDDDKVKITRVKRKGSFSNLSHGTSHFWATIYGSFKQVVPWRRKQEKQQRPNKFDSI